MSDSHAVCALCNSSTEEKTREHISLLRSYVCPACNALLRLAFRNEPFHSDIPVFPQEIVNGLRDWLNRQERLDAEQTLLLYRARVDDLLHQLKAVEENNIWMMEQATDLHEQLKQSLSKNSGTVPETTLSGLVEQRTELESKKDKNVFDYMQLYKIRVSELMHLLLDLEAHFAWLSDDYRKLKDAKKADAGLQSGDCPEENRGERPASS